MNKLKNLRHSTFFFGGLIGMVLFVSLGYYMYNNPQYDCNSVDFAWWATGTDVKEPSGKIIHLPSCKETMASWFTYSEFVVSIGLAFPIGGIILANWSGELDFSPLSKKEIDEHNTKIHWKNNRTYPKGFSTLSQGDQN